MTDCGHDLQVGFEEVDKDDVEDFLLSHNVELSNEDLLALEEERIREESESSPEEVLPVKTLTMKFIAKGFNLVDEAMALFHEHDLNCMRSSKVRREMDNVLKCFKEVSKQKMKAATQVSIMKFFKKLPNESASISASEPSTSTGQLATSNMFCIKPQS